MITKKGINLDVCYYCKTSIDDLSRTIDHIVPKSRGGILSNKNKLPSCSKCNKLKADMTIPEFIVALNSMIFLEHTKHKNNVSYLKKVKSNATMIENKTYYDGGK